MLPSVLKSKELNAENVKGFWKYVTTIPNMYFTLMNLQAGIMKE